MPTVVVFDCESDDKPTRTGSQSVPDFRFVQCTVACALVIDAGPCTMPHATDELLRTARKITCWRDVVPRAGASPFQDLFDAFDEAYLIVGYNQLDFDMPLLRKYYGGACAQNQYASHRMKCLDIFQRVRGVLEYWPKLEHLLQFNGLPGKSGSGENAIRLWRCGMRKELEHYCAIDVLRTAQLALLPSMRIGWEPVTVHIPGYDRLKSTLTLNRYCSATVLTLCAFDSFYASIASGHVYGVAPALSSVLTALKATSGGGVGDVNVTWTPT